MQIDVHHLSRVYKESRGLLPIDFSVARGELIAVVGHNGAGKSTLLKLLCGWLIPEGGDVRIDGIDLKNRQALVSKIGFVPETPNLFDCMSVEYNLTLFARLFKVPSRRIQETLEEFNLVPFRHSKVESLSKGSQYQV